GATPQKGMAGRFYPSPPFVRVRTTYISGRADVPSWASVNDASDVFPVLRAGGWAKEESCMNIERYTERARGFIQSAQTGALGKGHQQFAPVHLLKVLLDDDQGMASGLIERAGGDPKSVRAGVEAALNKIPKVSGDAGQLYLGRELARVFDTAESARSE